MRPGANKLSRRVFLGAAGVAASVAAAQDTAAGGSADTRELVSTADLVYDRPVPRSEEGIPVGNGRMGSLVWTSPDQIHLQINRPDVYANGSSTNSFFERHNDYCGGCGFIDIDFDGDVFPESGFRQHLSIYDGLLTVNGVGATARLLGWPEQDVMALEMETPRGVTTVLRSLRYETKYFGAELEPFARDHVNRVQTRNHTADSQLAVRGNRILLTQEFREGDYCCKSAVAIGIAGRNGQARVANDTEVRLSAPPGAGAFTILIASAATFDAHEDVAASALRQLDAAAAKGWNALAKDTADWWHDFW
jgi:hypothetical protein